MSTVVFEVRWFVANQFSERVMRKEFGNMADAIEFKNAQAAKNTGRMYDVYRIETEKVG